MQRTKAENDTVFAPASAVGGAIAAIRVSGPDAAQTERILSAHVTASPRKMLHTDILSGGEIIDDAMAVFYPAPRSYTGEDMAELYCHGGARTVSAVLGALSGIGFRPAEGGEFTRRAFLNGKMDLSQAEAVMDIITADAEQSLKSALRQLKGAVGAQLTGTETLLTDALSAIDAAIDYPDEAEEDALNALPAMLAEADDTLTALIETGRRNRVLRDGIRVGIFGRPNVGKSSLLNALTGEDRAIVTDIAGTTRDIIDVKTSFYGVPVRLIDTAGIRETDNVVERIGVDRARQVLADADIALVVLDGSASLTDEDGALLEETKGMPRVLIVNKDDLPQQAELPVTDGTAVPVSARTGEGIDTLKRRVYDLACPGGTDASAITNERHLNALSRSCAAVRSARRAVELDCVATDIRDALKCLGEITGSDVDENVIDRIFERFCVGK